MKIYLNIEAETPSDLAEALAQLGQMAIPATLPRSYPAEVPAPVNQKVAEPASPVAEEPKKTRGRPAKAAAEAKPENPTTAASGGEPAATSAAPSEPPALTFDEVRGMIIDLLNDWTAAKPDDPDIRKKVLSPMLDWLGHEKLSQIELKDFGGALALVEESRAKLAAYTGGNPKE